MIKDKTQPKQIAQSYSLLCAAILKLAYTDKQVYQKYLENKVTSNTKATNILPVTFDAEMYDIYTTLASRFCSLDIRYKK